MNAYLPTEALPAPLMEIVELKWLMAGEGVRVHVEHMIDDNAYATRVLNRALESASPALRAAAERLRTRLVRG